MAVARCTVSSMSRRLHVELRGRDDLPVVGGSLRRREIDGRFRGRAGIGRLARLGRRRGPRSRPRRREVRAARRFRIGSRTAGEGCGQGAGHADHRECAKAACAHGLPRCSGPSRSCSVWVSDARSGRPVPAYDDGRPSEECAMFEWSEELLMVRDAVRKFVDTEIRPHREELEHGDLPPYDLLRKLYKTFGMDQMAADSFDKRIAAEESRGERRRGGRRASASGGRWRRLHDAADHRALQVLAGHGHRDGRVGRAHRGRDHVEGHDRAEEALGARHAHDGQDRRVGDHRAGLRFRRVRVDGVDRAPRRRRVRAQRLEDVHHQRSVRRHDRVHLQARRGQRARRAQGRAVRARQRHARPRAVEAAAQDGPALVAHRHAVPRRRARRPRPPARRERRGVRRRQGPRGVEGHVRDGAFRVSPRWRSASSSAASSCR